MNNQTAFESTATSSQEQVLLNVPEGRANGQINDATTDFADELRGYGTASVSAQTRVSRLNAQPWFRWLVILLSWSGIFAVVLLGLILCAAAAVGLLVRHLQL